MSKASEIREMSDEQLGLTLKDTRETLFRRRIQAQTERLDAPSELRKNRRLISRLKTIQREREMATEAKATREAQAVQEAQATQETQPTQEIQAK